MAKVKAGKRSGFSKRKAGLSKMFGAAKKNFEDEGDPFGMTVPNGPYIATISAAERRESAGDQFISWQAVVEEGEQEGAIIGWRSNLTTEENLKWLLINFSRMGVEVNDLEIEDNDDLDQILTELVDAAPKVRLVANSDSGYQNVNINKLISVGEGTDEVPEETTEIEKGDRVEGDIDGTAYPGEIKKIKGDQITIEFDDGDTQTLDVSDVTKLEAEPDEVDWDGKQAGYRKGKKLFVGTITEVNEKKGTFEMETEEGKTVKGAIDDLLEAVEESEEGSLEKGDRVDGVIDGITFSGEVKQIEGDNVTIEFDDGDTDTLDISDVTKSEVETKEETADLEVGAKVEVTYKKKEYDGKVKAINEEDEEVTVFITKLKKKVTVPVDDIVIV